MTGMQGGPGLKRRRFLAHLASIGAAVAVTHVSGGLEGVLFPAAQAAGPEGITLHVPLRRAEDGLALDFYLVNLELDVSGPAARLTRRDMTKPAFLVVSFGSQALFERAFLETSGSSNEVPPAGAVKAYLADDSRLAFDVTEHLPLPFTVEALLNWVDFSPRLVPNADANILTSDLRPQKPSASQTALELPWRLQLSPSSGQTWIHSAEPVTHGGRSELWHTRLGLWALAGEDGTRRRIDVGDDPVPIRAVWATDPDFGKWLDNPSQIPTGPAPDGFRGTLKPRDRYDIVRLSSDFSLNGNDSVPGTIQASGLMLSSLGASADLEAKWDSEGESWGNYSASLQQWHHVLGLGREHEVKTVQKGYLYPFGHRAAFVTVSIRKFVKDAAGQVTAVLRQRQLVVTLEPSKNYGGDARIPNAQRAIPFRKLRVLSARHEVKDPSPFLQVGVLTAFVPTAPNSAAPLPFDFRGTDWAGSSVDMKIPVVFVPASGVTNAVFMSQLRAKYNALADLDPLRNGQIEGTPTAMAAAKSPGDTTVVLRSLRFTSDEPLPNKPYDPKSSPFFPRMITATAELPRVSALAGTDLDPITVKYYSGYLSGGFSSQTNPAGVFLALADGAPQPDLRFDGSRAGAVALPNFKVSGYSREFGPVGGSVADAARTVFRPEAVFGAIDARILGGIELKDILESLATPSPGQGVRMTFRDNYIQLGGKRVLESAEAELRWNPKVEAGPGNLALFEPEDGGNCLALSARAVQRLRPSVSSDFTVRGELKNFSVHLFGKAASSRFISIEFDALRFLSGKDIKPDVDVEIRNITFHGALRFLDEFSKLCSMFGNGPAGPQSASASAANVVVAGEKGSGFWVEVDDRGITAALAVSIPSISLGVFSLSNLAVSASLTIPFNGDPVLLNFSFCSRERPFTLSVGIFGGGGYVGLSASAGGVKSMEFSLEFGIGASLDLGIASGMVEMKGGILFTVRSTQAADGSTSQELELTAYLRLHGELSILGIVTLSLEFYMSLTYAPDPDRLVGEASVTVSIDVAFFSDSVTLHVRKEIAGGATAAQARANSLTGAPSRAAIAPASTAFTFGETHTQQTWNQYCNAFAPVGA
ncbi:hypothetical protein ABZV60_16900 [Streptomyces sp. NPDC004787]|uniref:hypothetical protein n=1 Tax=Streptomyces sp. NPDC004787 TaxID=3154291 RepID=UPI0033A47BEE